MMYRLIGQIIGYKIVIECWGLFRIEVSLDWCGIQKERILLDACILNIISGLFPSCFIALSFERCGLSLYEFDWSRWSARDRPIKLEQLQLEIHNNNNQ